MKIAKLLVQNWEISKNLKARVLQTLDISAVSLFMIAIDTNSGNRHDCSASQFNNSTMRNRTENITYYSSHTA